MNDKPITEKFLYTEVYERQYVYNIKCVKGVHSPFVCRTKKSNFTNFLEFFDTYTYFNENKRIKDVL